MANQAKPDVNTVWASGGLAAIPDKAKQALGYVAEIPDYDDFNGMIQLYSQFAKHVNQEGVALYDPLTTYAVGSLTKSAVDSNVYRATAETTGAAPIVVAGGAVNANWELYVLNEKEAFVATTGGVNAYVANFIAAPKTLFDGLTRFIKANNANTGAATLTVNGLGQRPLVGPDLLPLTGGEIKAGGYCTVTYSVAAASWILTFSSGGYAQAGRLIGMQAYTGGVGGVYTPTPGTKSVIVEVQGGGGGGGGAPATASGAGAAGGGGGAGGYSKARLTSGFAGQTVAIGVGGAGGGGVGASGQGGGVSSFGSSVIASGGGGGTTMAATVSYPIQAAGANGAVGGAGNIMSAPGSGGGAGVILSAGNGISGNGGASAFGGGGFKAVGNSAGGAGTYGGGGGGAISQGNPGGGFAGGAGGYGVVIIWEYS